MRGLLSILTLVLLLAYLPACDNSSSRTIISPQQKPGAPGRVDRVKAAPNIPANPNLKNFLGSWHREGELVFTIRPVDAGGIVEFDTDGTWDILVNNVRFEQDDLRFDVFSYYAGNEDFSAPGNATGDHPFSGVKVEYQLIASTDSDIIRVINTMPSIPDFRDDAEYTRD